MRISVWSDGRVFVSVPCFMNTDFEYFLIKKSGWIFRKLDYFKKFPIHAVSKKEDGRDFLRYREHARQLAFERVRHFNAQYGFTVHTIYIRNQKTRWGSCSKKGNLNFNYKIVLLPSRLSDYIVVHELCHLQELNHSPNFWSLVARAIPDHADIRKELKRVHNNALRGEKNGVS